MASTAPPGAVPVVPSNVPAAPSAAAPAPHHPEPKLLWNVDNVRDVAESVGIASLGDDALRCLSQDVEYRVGQVLVESLRFMRAARRTTLTVADVSLALRVLDVEPLYGYDSLRPLRYGEASLGAGQPLYYVEDEEVDFEKLINAPLPKVPRDMSFTAHWLAVEGVQPSIPQNPTSMESRSQELVPKGPGANPALAALAGNDNVQFKPSVKHIISKELILYFEKIQTALLDETPDEEVMRLREAALESVRSDPGLHQLVPYFVTFVSNQVTHHLDSPFVLRQMMELAAALVANEHLFLDPYASSLSSAVLTCLLSRKVGTSTGDASTTEPEALRTQYQLREFSASLVGQIARKYARSNSLLRPQLTRTCLKYFLDPSRTPAVLYGAILGLAAAGGPEVVRLTVLPNLRSYDTGVLQPLRERATAQGEPAEFETLVAGIMKAVRSLASIGKNAASAVTTTNGINGGGTSAREAAELVEFLGPIIGERVAALGDHHLNEVILAARAVE